AFGEVVPVADRDPHRRPARVLRLPEAVVAGRRPDVAGRGRHRRPGVRIPPGRLIHEFAPLRVRGQADPKGVDVHVFRQVKHRLMQHFGDQIVHLEHVDVRRV
ncbi:MAG: hypothetical protein ACK56I_21525, partial [bacterium]